MQGCAEVPAALRSRHAELNKSSESCGIPEGEAAFLGLCDQYCDIVHSCHPYPTAAMQLSAEESAVLLHAARHVCIKMDAVKRNNAGLEAGTVDSAAARDQGFVRPQVLLLAPMRSVALPIILHFAALAQRGNRC